MRRIASALLVCVAALASHGQAQQTQPEASTTGAPPAADADAPKPLTTHLRAFTIPFKSDLVREDGVVAVQLLVSADRGANWRLYATQNPNIKQFSFRSWGDGEYWFASRTVTADRRVNPETARPELKVVVDTTPPELEFDAVVSATGEVSATWTAADVQLAPGKSKLEYRGAGDAEWKSVEIEPNNTATTPHTGKASWRPESKSLFVEVRLQVADQVGHVQTANRRLLIPRFAAMGPAESEPRKLENLPADPFTSRRRPDEGAQQWPKDEQQHLEARKAPADDGSWRDNKISSGDDEMQNSPLPNTLRSSNETPAAVTKPVQPSDGGVTDLANLDRFKPQPSPTNPPVANRVDSQAATDETSAEDEFPVPDSGDVPHVTPRSPVAAADALPPGERPQMINRSRFPLAYDVESVGASGVARVELWATRDGGRSWQRWGEDSDRKSPLEVVVAEEGVYGFRVVVTNHDGLAGDAPQAGEAADIWLAVDTTKPTARIVAAPYGTGETAGQLDIQWEASDANLAPRPITLAFAENPAGNWTTIAGGLPNSGRYQWRVDPHVPRRIYLRLEVRDDAGNVGVHQLSEPINVSGLRPKARIRGVLPIETTPRTSSIPRLFR